MSKSYEYAILVQNKGVKLTGPAATSETEVAPTGVGWTHATAIYWAHVEGHKFPEGTVIRIWRWEDGPGRLPRQGHGAQHRAYVVRDGIARRTDR